MKGIMWVRSRVYLTFFFLLIGSYPLEQFSVEWFCDYFANAILAHFGTPFQTKAFPVDFSPKSRWHRAEWTRVSRSPLLVPRVDARRRKPTLSTSLERVFERTCLRLRPFGNHADQKNYWNEGKCNRQQRRNSQTIALGWFVWMLRRCHLPPWRKLSAGLAVLPLDLNGSLSSVLFPPNCDRWTHLPARNQTLLTFLPLSTSPLPLSLFGKKEICSISSRSRVLAHRPCPKLEMFCPSVLQLFYGCSKVLMTNHGMCFFVFVFMFFKPAGDPSSATLVPDLANQVWPFKSALFKTSRPGKRSWLTREASATERHGNDRLSKKGRPYYKINTKNYWK